MADVFTKKKRSEVMAGIRGKNTKPELVIRKALSAEGFRFRLHVKNIPGKPDIVLPKYKTVIFINGCFWHGHKGCKNFKIPKTRTDFWTAKILANQLRDRRAAVSLRREGWRVFTLWECKIRKHKENAARSVIRRLRLFSE